MKCYCNSNLDFTACCEPLLKARRKATTAEQLMRSRYSAYVMADINYLLMTHHKQSRPTKDRKSILSWTKSVQWISLEIVKSEKGNANDNVGYVEFKAFFMENGKLECIHENSRFVKDKGLWFYITGEHY